MSQHTWKQGSVLVNAYIWNLEKWYWWTYFQGRNRDADVKKGLVDTVGEGEGGTKWESSIDIYTLLYGKQLVGSCYITQGAQLGNLWQPRWVGWVGWEGGSRGRVYVYSYSCFTLLYDRN